MRRASCSPWLAGLHLLAWLSFSKRRFHRADVERRLRARYLGALPQLQSTVEEARGLEGPEDYVQSHPLSSFAESFRSLRAAATLRGHRPPKVLAITSALPLEGKTTTAVCLARTLAMSARGHCFSIVICAVTVRAICS